MIPPGLGRKKAGRWRSGRVGGSGCGALITRGLGVGGKY